MTTNTKREPDLTRIKSINLQNADKITMETAINQLADYILAQAARFEFETLPALEA